MSELGASIAIPLPRPDMAVASNIDLAAFKSALDRVASNGNQPPTQLGEQTPVGQGANQAGANQTAQLSKPATADRSASEPRGPAQSTTTATPTVTYDAVPSARPSPEGLGPSKAKADKKASAPTTLLLSQLPETFPALDGIAEFDVASPLVAEVVPATTPGSAALRTLRAIADGALTDAVTDALNNGTLARPLDASGVETPAATDALYFLLDEVQALAGRVLELGPYEGVIFSSEYEETFWVTYWNELFGDGNPQGEPFGFEDSLHYSVNAALIMPFDLAYTRIVLTNIVETEQQRLASDYSRRLDRRTNAMR